MIIRNSYSLTIDAFKNSSNLIGFKLYKIFSKPLNAFLAVFVLAVFALALFVPSNLVNTASYLISSDSEIYKEFISTAFVLVAANNGVDAVNIWLSGLLATVFLAPIISNTLNSSHSKKLLLGVRRNISYQISDSILLQFLSPLVIVALIYTLFFAFLLRYEYALSHNILTIMLSVWFLSVLMFTFVGWVNELCSRKHGIKYKIFYTLSIGVIALTIYATNFGAYIFGLADLMVVFLLESSNSNAAALAFLAFALVLVSIIVFSVFIVGFKTLHKYPPPYKKQSYKVKYDELYLNIFRIMFRYDNVRAPLIFMTVILTLIFVFQPEGNTQTLYGLAFIFPLVLSLTVFVNIFGIINSGNTWVAVLPKVRLKLFRKTVVFALFLSIFGAAFISIPALAVGSIEPYVWVKFMSLSLLATLLTMIVSLTNSFKNPLKYDIQTRGENIVPPGNALKLTGFILLVSGGPTIIAGSILQPLQIIMVAIIVYLILEARIQKLSKKLITGYDMNRIAALTS